MLKTEHRQPACKAPWQRSTGGGSAIEDEEKGKKIRTVFSTTINFFDKRDFSRQLIIWNACVNSQIFLGVNWNRPLAIKIPTLRPPRWVRDVTPYANKASLVTPRVRDATASKTSENMTERELKEADAVFTTKLFYFYLDYCNRTSTALKSTLYVEYSEASNGLCHEFPQITSYHKNY